MNDIFGKVFGILLCVWLMFFYPLAVAREENKKLERMYLYQETVEFVDGVRNIGVVKNSDLQQYLSKVSSMNTLYSVHITHKRQLSGADETENESVQIEDGSMETKNEERERTCEYYYNQEIFQVLSEGEDYQMYYNDFIKIVIEDEKENMVLCYGGGVKAVREKEAEDEVN